MGESQIRCPRLKTKKGKLELPVPSVSSRVVPNVVLRSSLSAFMNLLLVAPCAFLLLGAFSAPAHAQSA
jgi:hypothetical protein